MSGSNPTGPAPGAAGTTDATTTSSGAAPAVLTEARIAELIQQGIATATQGLTTRLSEAETALTAERSAREAQAVETRGLRAREAAQKAVDTALDRVPVELRGQIGPRVSASVVADVPLTEAGVVDEEKLCTRISEAIAREATHVAEVLEQYGIGVPRGLGVTEPTAPQTDEQYTTALTEAFRSFGLGADAAAIAAAGRK